MIEYIQTMISTLSERIGKLQTEGIESRFASAYEELCRLEPADFEPSQRFEFVEARRFLRPFASNKNDAWNELKRYMALQGTVNIERSAVQILLAHFELFEETQYQIPDPVRDRAQVGNLINTCLTRRLQRLKAVLDHYRPGGGVKLRSFSYIEDTELQKLVDRDYHDLALRLFPMKTWKSVVILAGSILEALLFDLLTCEPARIAAAMSAKKAPKKPGARPPVTRDIEGTTSEDQWMLNDYIEVSDALNYLPLGWKAGVQAVLRDFRNYVHPRKELRAADPISEGEAYQSVGVLMKICDHIEKTHP